MQELFIQPAQEGKGRTFQSILTAYVVADALWFGGAASATDKDLIRPVWMMLAGSEAELRPFVANLQTGRKAEVGTPNSSRSRTTRVETLKSAGYHFAWQRTSLGAVVTCYLPDLFRLDPGMVDPKGIEFCILPAKRWLCDVDKRAEAHLAALGANVGDEAVQRVLSLAPLFVAYLDRRTRCPLVPDPRFHAQVLFAALGAGLASWSTPASAYWRDCGWGEHRNVCFHEVNTERVGLARGLAFKASHEQLEAFLAEQAKLYFEVDHG